MVQNFMKSTLAKLVAVGVVAAACVGVTAVPASASDEPFVGSGTVHVAGGAQIGAGEAFEKRRMFSVEVKKDAQGNPMMVQKWGWKSYNGIASAEFPIVDKNGDTGFYLKVAMRTNFVVSLPWGVCEVYLGKPSSKDGHVVSSSPYTCDVIQRDWDNDWDYVLSRR
jgi:hypothetical protein